MALYYDKKTMTRKKCGDFFPLKQDLKVIDTKV